MNTSLTSYISSYTHMDTLSSNTAPGAPMVFWATIRAAAQAHAPEPIMATWREAGRIVGGWEGRGGVVWGREDSGWLGGAGRGRAVWYPVSHSRILQHEGSLKLHAPHYTG